MPKSPTDETKSEDTAPDEAGIRIPPPLIFLVFLAIGLWAGSNFSWPGSWPIYIKLLGVVLILIGLALILASGSLFRKAKTHIEPWRPTKAIVDTGVYAFSRNPIYLGMVLAYLGIALAAESLIAIALVIPAIAIIRYYVIGREERYLERKFGPEYLAYKSRVRRWI